MGMKTGLWMKPLLAALAVALTGCSLQHGGACYIDTLHRAWQDIDRAIQEDGSLRQTDLNMGSGIAVTLAREEAAYWSGLLAEKGMAAPKWETRLQEIAEAAGEYEGGSAAPLAKHQEMLDCLDEAIREMRAACGKR